MYKPHRKTFDSIFFACYSDFKVPAGLIPQADNRTRAGIAAARGNIVKNTSDVKI